MRLLYADESGESQREGSFFFYGGIAVPEAGALALRGAVRTALLRAGWSDLTKPLKFDTNEPRPSAINPEQHKSLKKEVVRLAGLHGCRLFCAAILNAIAIDASKRREFQINTVLDNFNTDLARQNDVGLVIIDTFTASRRLRDIAKDRYSSGLVFPGRGKRTLHRVLGIHEGASGCSDFASVADVVIGSIRYAVNGCGTARRHVAMELVGQLGPLCPRNSRGKVINRFFMLSPRLGIAKHHVADYERLCALFADTGVPLDWTSPATRVRQTTVPQKRAAVRPVRTTPIHL